MDGDITKNHSIEGVYKDQPFRSNVDFLNSGGKAFEDDMNNFAPNVGVVWSTNFTGDVGTPTLRWQKGPPRTTTDGPNVIH